MWDSLIRLARRFDRSRLVRHAAVLLGVNVLTRTATFFGTAYAAKCLGPSNLGISALVQSVALAAATIAAGGMDSVAVRRIASTPDCARSLARKILKLRAWALAAIIPVGLILVAWLVPPAHFFAWGMGGILLIATVFSPAFIFQGLERLPTQAAFSLLSGGLAALACFTLFRPGVPAGSDLAVSGLTTLLAVGLGWWTIGSISKPAVCGSVPSTTSLMREARPYWILSMVVYCYSTLQIPLVGVLAGSASLGVYRSALMLAAGLELLYGSLNTLLLPRLVRWRQGGITLLRHKQDMLLVLFMCIGVCAASITMGVAPHVYRLMLGSSFEAGVIPFQILVVARTIVFVGQIYSNTLIAIGLDRQFLWASCAGAVFSVVANLCMVRAAGITGAAVVSLLSEVVVCGLCFMFTRQYFRKLGSTPVSTAG